MRTVAMIVCATILSGCSLFPKQVRPPSATISLPSGAQLGQTGSARKPASVETAVTTTTIPLPAQTSIVLDEKEPGKVTLQLAAQSELKTETKTEKAEAPQAFTPPAPPSPSEIAEGNAKRWFYAGLVLGVTAGLFGLVRDWDFVMYGGGAVAGGCAFALFVQAHPLVFVVIGIGVALKVAGPTLWHLKLKHLEK